MRADVEREGIDGFVDLGEGFDDGEAFDFFEGRIDRDDAVAGVAQAADGHVRVAFRIIAGAEDGNSLRGHSQTASCIMAFIFVSTSSATAARAGEAESAESNFVGNAVAILVLPPSS